MIPPDLVPPLLTALRFLVVGLGALVHGALGIGFPMIATPLLTLFSDVRTAMLLILIPTLAVNVTSILAGGGWREAVGRHWPLAAFAVAGTFIGTRLLIETDPAPFKLVMAGSLLLYLNAHRTGRSLAWIRRRPRLAVGVFGLFGGFLAGTVNAMVPALIVYTLEMGLPMKAMVQVFNFCFLAGKAAQGATFAASGLFTREVVLESLPLAVAALAALRVGMAFRSRLPEASYRMWLRRCLLAIAVLLVLQFGFGR